jgi:flagellar protein FliL
MKRNMKIGIAAAAVVLAAAFGAVALAGAVPFGAAKASDTRTEKSLASADVRYVQLDRLVVMLRDDASVRPRYVSIDLVLTAPTQKHEKQVREQLPMLRAVSYQALSDLSVADVRRMRPTDYSTRLVSAFDTTYGGPGARPFDNVMIARVMVD